MPFRYNRKTDRASWSLNNMTAAINAVQIKSMGIRKAARTHNVPYATLQDRLRGKVDQTKKILGRPTVLNFAQEEELANHIVKLSKAFYGLSRLQVKKIAFQYAESNSIPNNFNKAKGICGNDWYYGFLKRHPQISLRKPESTSLNRVKGFNKQEVDIFFSNLLEAFDKYNYQPNKIFNADETGITPVHIPAKILAAKGQRQVGAITSGERGKLVTVLCAMSAAGDYIPPMFIFGRARMKYELTKNGPVNAIYKISKNGWINEDLFYEWIQHFAKYTKCSVNDRVLLVIDNHSSHCTLKVFNFCKENGIDIVTLPPHTSHRLQPLDVCFFGPLKTAYNRECDYFLKSKNYQKIDQSDIAELFKKAYNKTATIEKGVKGFEATGIFPLNRDVVNEEEFIIIEEHKVDSAYLGQENSKTEEAKKRTERNEKTDDIVTTENESMSEAGPSGVNVKKVSKRPPNKINSDSESENSVVYYTDEESDNDQDKSVSANVSFEDLQPVPRFLRSGQEKERKTHSQFFTITPNKLQLEAKESAKFRKMELQKSKATKRKISAEDNSDKVELKAEKNSKLKPSKEQKLKGKVRKILADKNVQDSKNKKKVLQVATEPCIVCMEFGKDEEWWVTKVIPFRMCGSRNYPSVYLSFLSAVA